jgi:hypothetical protein
MSDIALGIIPPEYDKFQTQITLTRAPDWNTRDVPQFNNTRDILPVFRLMRSADREWLLIICLDAQLHLVGLYEMAIGDQTSSMYSILELARIITSTGAINIIVAHNHPSGTPDPSDADKRSYDKTIKLVEVLGVGLLDWLIVGVDKIYSMKGNNYIPFPADMPRPIRSVSVPPGAEREGEAMARPHNRPKPELTVPSEAVPGRELAKRLQPAGQRRLFDRPNRQETPREKEITKRLKYLSQSYEFAYENVLATGPEPLKRIEKERDDLYAELKRIRNPEQETNPEPKPEKRVGMPLIHTPDGVEVWQMTKDEFIQYQIASNPWLTEPEIKALTYKWEMDVHRPAVRAALVEKKPVPAKVLAEYPMWQPVKPSPPVWSSPVVLKPITPMQARLFDRIRLAWLRDLYDTIISKLEHPNMSPDQVREALVWRPLRELVAWAVGTGKPVQLFKMGMIEGTYQLTFRELTPTLYGHVALHVKDVPRIKRVYSPVNEAVFEIIVPGPERKELEFVPQEVKRAPRFQPVAQAVLFGGK